MRVMRSFRKAMLLNLADYLLLVSYMAQNAAFEMYAKGKGKPL
jgi:thymidylate synthase